MAISTKVTRILSFQKIPYTFYEYENDGSLTGMEIAELQGQNPAQVLKTIILIGQSKKLYCFCIPVLYKIDLKSVAHQLGEKKVQLYTRAYLPETVGYVHGSCSPIGLTKEMPIYFDASTEQFDEIYISAGAIGKQIKIAFKDLAKVIKFDFMDAVSDS